MLKNLPKSFKYEPLISANVEKMRIMISKGDVRVKICVKPN